MSALGRVWLLAVAVSLAAAGCARGGQPGKASLAGTIRVDGSSTVFPITEAVAEEFGKLHPRVRVTVGISGTGGGFKKFVEGVTDLQDASRPITASERERARRAGIEYAEVPVGYDGLAVVVNPANGWADCLSVTELGRIWEPGSKVALWRDVRPGWPDTPLRLFGPGTDSGTFDYFTEAVVGEARKSRPDYTASEDDNVLVAGVAGERGALGYFGFAYYEENRDRLKILGVDGGKGCVVPDADKVRSGEYPLARPLFLYVNRASLSRPEVREFLRFYLREGPELVRQVGYVPLPKERYAASLRELGLGQ